MARKDSVPKPPRKVQAPQRRTTPSGGGGDGGSRRALLVGLGLAGLALLAVVLGVLLLGGGGKSEAAALEEEGCRLQTFPGQEAEHVDEPDAKPKWNSSPPTSGPHASVPAVYGFYTEEVPLMRAVHNLEHGAVVIYLGKDVSDETVGQVRAFYEQDPNGILVAGYPKLGDEVALTAWTANEPGGRGRGYLATCSGFSETAFSRFVEEHRYKGPERFPEDSLQPGTT